MRLPRLSAHLTTRQRFIATAMIVSGITITILGVATILVLAHLGQTSLVIWAATLIFGVGSVATAYEQWGDDQDDEIAAAEKAAQEAPAAPQDTEEDPARPDLQVLRGRPAQPRPSRHTPADRNERAAG